MNFDQICKDICDSRNFIKLNVKKIEENKYYKLALNNSGGIGLLGINERLKSMNAKLKQKKDETENVIIITVEL